jgi:hypothetical protein
MRSKRAWLIQGNNTISTDKQKLPPKDVEEELIQYALEFKINQKYDEETYSSKFELDLSPFKISDTENNWFSDCFLLNIRFLLVLI